MVELDDHVAAVDLLNDSAHQDPDLVRVLLEHLVALRLAHALDQHLLGGLDRVAAEFRDLQRKRKHVADLGVAVLRELARFGDRELERGILDELDHVAPQRDLDLAGLVRELHLDVGGGTVLLTDRAGEPGLERLDQQRAIDTLLARDLAQGIQDLVVHRVPPSP
jgi:hypothetical protein